MPEVSPLSPEYLISKADGLGGLAKNSRFTVQITPPVALTSDTVPDTINFLCHRAQIPSYGFQTTEDRVYGIEVLKPYGVQFEAMSLTFYNTNNFAPRKFWEDWLAHIQPPKTRNMTYYDDMVGDIKIYHFSEDTLEPTAGNENYYCQLLECWPLSLEESDLDWGEDEFESGAFDVQIQYKYWSRDGTRTLGARTHSTLTNQGPPR